jgi:hypothetical protein
MPDTDLPGTDGAAGPAGRGQPGSIGRSAIGGPFRATGGIAHG